MLILEGNGAISSFVESFWLSERALLRNVELFAAESSGGDEGANEIHERPRAEERKVLRLPAMVLRYPSDSLPPNTPTLLINDRYIDNKY